MKNKWRLTAITAWATILALAVMGCTHPPQGQLTKVSFHQNILPIFTTYCAINSSCHLGANGANDEVSLDSASAYTSLISKNLLNLSDPTASILYQQVATGVMPKSPQAKLSDADINLILLWIQQGAPDN